MSSLVSPPLAYQRGLLDCTLSICLLNLPFRLAGDSHQMFSFIFTENNLKKGKKKKKNTFRMWSATILLSFLNFNP